MAAEKQFILIIPDGAGDIHRLEGRSPLAEASIPHWDRLAAEGVCGLMQTLYDDLPRGSIVAQLGMLGWNPYLYSGHGRATWELLALSDVEINPGDLILRANLVRMMERRLISYNAGFILTETAIPLVERINAVLGPEFPDIELHHNCDFRNSLVLRDAGIDPALLVCPEPHDHEGTEFDVGRLIAGRDSGSEAVAARLNRYLVRVAQVLAGEPANMIFPWSASGSVTLPAFRDNTGFTGRSAIVGCMDFLKGIAKAGSIDFFKVGNGRPDTDYAAKGAKVLELLDAGYSFVVCHVNSPDEAAHMHDREMKVRCLEAIDRHVLGPIAEYVRLHREQIGGLMVAPDHYTNLLLGPVRADAHSLHPVPFVIWNGRDRDGVSRFDEDSVREGRFGASPVHHLDLLQILGVARRGGQRSGERVRKASSVLELMQDSPLVALHGRGGPAPRPRLWGKLELALPGAMKDRVAREIVERAEASGELRPGGTIVESSSGTMAEGLARVGALKDYRVIIVTDPRIDALTRAKLEALGATLEVVDTYHASGGWQRSRLERLREVLAANPGAVWSRQYDSPGNAGAYEGSVARELLDALGTSIGALIGTVGSGGSLCGTARGLRRAIPDLRVIAVDAVGSALFHQPDRRRLQSGHGNSIIPGNLDYSIIDEVHWVTDAEAFNACRELARREGIFAGGSSGAAYVAASWAAGQVGDGRHAVVILPDRGDRYFESIYSDRWFEEHGLADRPAAASPETVRYGQDIAERWSRAELPHDGSVPYHAPEVQRTADLTRELGMA